MKHLRNIKTLTLSFILIVVFGGCTKNELPKPIEGTPQVWLECKINGNYFKFEAGKDLNFACPIVNDGSNGVIRQFTSEIKSAKFQKAIKITINNNQATSPSMEDDMANTIVPRVYKFSYTNQFPTYFYKMGEVIIDYKDLNSQSLYTTLPYPQSGVGSFEIVSVKDVHHEGVNYKLAEIKFSCRAKNPSNGAKYNITEGHGFIPFGQQ